MVSLNPYSGKTKDENQKIPTVNKKRDRLTIPFLKKMSK